MKHFLWFATVAIVPWLTFAVSNAADWPSFRGPTGSGASEGVDLPAKWTADSFVWKVKLPGPGTATPVTVGDKIFVTCYVGYGTDVSVARTFDLRSAFGKDQDNKGGAEPEQKQFGKGGFGGNGGSGRFGGQGGFEKFGGQGGFGGKGGFGGGFGGGNATGNATEQKKLAFGVACLDAQTGKQLWLQNVEPKLPEASFSGFLREHGYATSTPVVDAERVYAFFGKTGVLAFTHEGKKLWHAEVGSNVNNFGTAASLVLHKGLVIVNAGVESNSLIALDKATGKEVWRAKGIATNWTTPIIVPTKDKDHELVLPLTDKISGFDPTTGKLLWHVAGTASDKQGGSGYGYSTVFASPVAREDVVFVCESGGMGMQQSTMAIRAGGRGDVTNTHVLWRQKVGTQFNSPVAAGDFVYALNGTVTCMRADTGKIVYKERLTESGDYPSPIVAGDKLLALTRTDGLYVLAAGAKFLPLTHNVFDGDNSGFNASPAVSNGRLLVRSNAYLYCIANKASR